MNHFSNNTHVYLISSSYNNSNSNSNSSSMRTIVITFTIIIIIIIILIAIAPWRILLLQALWIWMTLPMMLLRTTSPHLRPPSLVMMMMMMMIVLFNPTHGQTPRWIPCYSWEGMIRTLWYHDNRKVTWVRPLPLALRSTHWLYSLTPYEVWLQVQKVSTVTQLIDKPFITVVRVMLSLSLNSIIIILIIITVTHCIHIHKLNHRILVMRRILARIMQRP